MHQNTFLPTPDIKKYLLKNLILAVWKYAQMHQNTFLTTPEVNKIILKDLILVVWKYAQMHENTFLTTPEVLFFKDLILVVRKCIKTGF
jgi:hypothetical protein